MLMAIRTSHPMNIMRTLRVRKRRIHLLHINAAVRHLRMARFARGRRVFAMPVVASYAADSLVNSDRRPIIPRPKLRTPSLRRRNTAGIRPARRVALIADRLPLIRTDPHRTWPIKHHRQRQLTRRKVHLLAPVVERQSHRNRRNHPRTPLRRLRLNRTFAMHLVTGHARHRRLVRKRSTHKMPWPHSVHRLHQLSNRPVEVHPMAPQTVIRKSSLRIVHRIRKDLRIRRAMRPRMPACVFMLMALLTHRRHGDHIHIAQTD